MLGSSTVGLVKALAVRCEAARCVAELEAIIETTLLSTQICSFVYLHIASASHDALAEPEIKMHFGTSPLEHAIYKSGISSPAKSLWGASEDVVISVKGGGRVSGCFVLGFHDPKMIFMPEQKALLQDMCRRIHLAYLEASLSEVSRVSV